MKKEKEINENRIQGVGRVASGCKPQNMRFYSQQQINEDYAMIETEEGEKIIYEVTDVDVYNSRMEDIELVRHILPGEDYTRYNIYRANAKPLGMIKDGELCLVQRWFVASPGSLVKMADSQEISMVYGVEKCEGKQKIGRIIRHEQISVWLDIPKLLTTHMAMVGRSGQGKSNLAKTILRYLPMKYMVFTKVNEYTDIQAAHRVDLKHVSIGMNIDLLRKIYELSNTEIQYLRTYLKTEKIPEKIYSYELAENIRRHFFATSEDDFQQISFFREIEKAKTASIPKFVESLCKKIESITIEIVDAKQEWKEEDESCIINMQNLSDKEEEMALYAYLIPILENRRKHYKNTEQVFSLEERIVIFIEEAHNYIPSTKSAFCKDIIRQVAREGRKLGIHLVLMSQRPRHIDPTALSQCGSIVAFNLTNPEDIDYLMNNANFYGDYYKDIISNLKIGECTIVSDYLMRAINCRVDYKY